MLQILILSGSTGEGHNSCAKAIKEKFESNSHSCTIVDSFLFFSPFIAKAISAGHSLIYRYVPFMFRYGYAFFEKHSKIYSGSSLLDSFFSWGGKKLAAYINSNNYDIIICAHAFSAFMLTKAQKYLKYESKTAFVATDFTCSPTAEKSIVDTFFIPHESLMDEFANLGVDKTKIIPVGIPVRSDFYNTVDKQYAKQTVGVNPKNKHLLIMCGSMGCGPISNITLKIAKQVSMDTEITVICGKNKSLFKRLSCIHKGNPNVHICGFTDKISLYMDSADVYMTKPGGISLSEGSVKKLPMVILESVGGCESHNLTFYKCHGAALGGTKDCNTVNCCIELLNDNDLCIQMKENLSALKIDDAINQIYNVLIK